MFSLTSQNILCLLLTEFLTRHDRGNLKKKYKHYICPKLRRRNGAWFDTQLRHVSTLTYTHTHTHTHIYIYIYIYLRAQSRYLTADLHIILTHNSVFSGHNF